MKQLKTLLEDPNGRSKIITDCVQLVESEVRSKGGLTGMAVKTAFSIVKAVKPGIIQELVDGLIGQFVERLQPHYEAFQQQDAGGTLRAFLGSRSGEVAESLLGVTDDRAQKSTNKTLVKAYQKLRPKGKEHVMAAAPGIGGVLDRHVGSL